MLLRLQHTVNLARHLSYLWFFQDYDHPHHTYKFPGMARTWQLEQALMGAVREEIDGNLRNNKLTIHEFQSYRNSLLNKLEEGIEKLKQKKPPEGHRTYELKGDATEIEFKVWMDLGEEQLTYPANIARVLDLQHFYEVEMYPVCLERAESIYQEMRNYIDSFIVGSPASTQQHSVHIEQVKGQHLQILCHAIFKYCSDQQLEIEKKQIAEAIGSTFKKNKSEHFAVGRILTGAKSKLTEAQMTEVANVLYQIANLIDDQIREDPENGYFSKG